MLKIGPADTPLTTLSFPLPNEAISLAMMEFLSSAVYLLWNCLLYTSDAADEGLGVDLGGRRIIKKKKLGKKPTDTLTEERIASVVNSYSAIKDSKNIINVLDSINSPVEYLLTSDGSVRMRCAHNL